VDAKEIYIFIAPFALGLLAKWIWDRFLSKKNRVSAEYCELHRQQIKLKSQEFVQTCVREIDSSITEMKNDLKDMKKRMDEGEVYFGKLNKFQTIFAMIMLQICEKEKIDCSDIRKAMYEEGILK